MTIAVQPGGGHYPWLDDPAAFAATVEGFLRRTAATGAPARGSR